VGISLGRRFAWAAAAFAAVALALGGTPAGALASVGTTSFVDDFNGPAGASPNPQTWSFDTGGEWGYGAQLQYYTSRPSNASLDGQGHLVISANAETYVGPDGVMRQYTSARLQTWKKLDFTYGSISARIQVPAGKGLWPGFWAFGDDAYSSNDWPNCGEIDVMEFNGANPNLLLGTLHGPQTGVPNGYAVGGTEQSATPFSAGFHTYEADWAPTGVRFLVDGRTYATITPSQLPAGSGWPFNHPFFVALDLAVGDWVGAPDASTRFPAKMLVDWVRVAPSSWTGPTGSGPTSAGTGPTSTGTAPSTAKTRTKRAVARAAGTTRTGHKSHKRSCRRGARCARRHRVHHHRRPHRKDHGPVGDWGAKPISARIA